jgi:hypothetical protein
MVGVKTPPTGRIARPKHFQAETGNEREKKRRMI